MARAVEPGRREEAGPAGRLVDFFEEGVAAGKGVLELIGTDVAAFTDNLIKDSRTNADVYRDSLGG